ELLTRDLPMQVHDTQRLNQPPRCVWSKAERVLHNGLEIVLNDAIIVERDKGYLVVRHRLSGRAGAHKVPHVTQPMVVKAADEELTLVSTVVFRAEDLQGDRRLPDLDRLCVVALKKG